MRGIVGFEGLGDTGAWYRAYAAPSEVYLFRAELTGAELTLLDDALALVAAVGRAQGLGLDVQGVALRRTAAGAIMDVPLVTAVTRIYAPLVYEDAEGIARAVASDAALRDRFPKLGIRAPELLQLTGPPAAIDFWRSQAPLWSAALGQTGRGGPTAAFAERRGVWLGAADDAPQLQPWTEKQPGLAPAESKNEKHTVLWVTAGLVLAWLIARAL